MKSNGSKDTTFKVQRYNPEKDTSPYFDIFVVPTTRGMTVLDALLYIKENLDNTLAFRTSCRMAICGSCGMLINHYPHLACHTQIEELRTKTVTIQPLPNLPVIKDLVVDLAPLFEKHKSVKPYIIRSDTAEMDNPSAEFAQSPEELENFLQFTYCIKCGICISACPTSATDELFLGPQALAQCYRYCADTRDHGEQERLPRVDSENGVWHCHLAGACSDACPKGVDPALAIQLLKRRLVARATKIAKEKGPAPVVSPPTYIKPKLPFPEFTAGRNAATTEG